MDKTPQIAEEQLVIMMDKAQETKLQKILSADISRSEEISRWRPINKTLHYDFSATKTFFKNRHNCLSEGVAFFPAMGSTRSETKHSFFRAFRGRTFPPLKSLIPMHHYAKSQYICSPKKLVFPPNFKILE